MADLWEGLSIRLEFLCRTGDFPPRQRAVRRGVAGGAMPDYGRVAMYDALMLALGCGFFVAAVLYALACEKM